MSFTKFESVSSFVDSHDLSDEKIKQLSADQEMSETWQRYHLVGDIMRDEASADLQLDLSESIAQALAEEPTILAPQSWQHRAKAKVVALSKPLGQFAIAASAAFIMILGVQQANHNDDLPQVQNPVVQTMPIGGIADPVSFNFKQNTKPSQQAQQQAYIERQRKFNALLNDHKQQLKLQAQHSAEQQEPDHNKEK